MARTNTVEAAGDFLPRFIGSLAGKKKFQENFVFFHWEKIVGSMLAAHVKPMRLDFRTLLLAADTPVWANELRYMERSLIDKVNGYVGEELVKAVRFSSSNGRTWPASLKKKLAPKTWLAPEEEEKKQAADICAAVQDSEVQDALARAMAQAIARQRQAIAAGGEICPRCGALSAGRSLCPSCERRERQEKRRHIRRLLLSQPWLRYHEINKAVPCSPDLAMAARWELAQELSSRVIMGDETSDDARRLAMLVASLTPEKLSAEKLHQILRRLRFDLRPNVTYLPSRDGGCRRPVRSWRDGRRDSSPGNHPDIYLLDS